MDEVYLNRAHQADLEIRGDGRTVVGIAVPFDAPTPIRDASGSYTELFRRGAFAKTISERGDRVKFLAQHDRRAMPLGRATLLREDAAGLYAEFRVSQTRDGDDALALIRDGALVPLAGNGFWGTGVQYEDVSQGFVVRARLAGDQVRLDIEARNDRLEGGTVRTGALASSVSGRLGEWIPLGGSTAGSESTGSGLTTRHSTRGSADELLEVRVEAIDTP